MQKIIKRINSNLIIDLEAHEMEGRRYAQIRCVLNGVEFVGYAGGVKGDCAYLVIPKQLSEELTLEAGDLVNFEIQFFLSREITSKNVPHFLRKRLDDENLSLNVMHESDRRHAISAIKEAKRGPLREARIAALINTLTYISQTRK